MIAASDKPPDGAGNALQIRALIIRRSRNCRIARQVCAHLPAEGSSMNSKIFLVVAAGGVLLGANAVAQQPPRADGARSAAPAHETQKRSSVRQRGAAHSAPRHTASGERGDQTTGFGGGSGDDAFADDPSVGNREGHLRGDRGAGMMDNVRRDDLEPPE
jgi:hypothetical protein